MSDRHAASDGRAVDAAFNRVLRAEAAARSALADCRAQAAQRVTEAEQRARAITRRAERRIQAAHGIADRGIERGLAEIAAQAEAATAALEPDADTVRALVAALAAELTEDGP